MYENKLFFYFHRINFYYLNFKVNRSRGSLSKIEEHDRVYERKKVWEPMIYQIYGIGKNNYEQLK